MKYIPLTILIQLLWMLPLASQSPTFPERFDHFSTADGLSQGMINAVWQDRTGFLWIGTKDGLDRYDGYDFLRFRRDPADSTSLTSNFIKEIYEDQAGYVWISTNLGLNRYDPAQEVFRQYQFEWAGDNSLRANDVMDFLEDQSHGKAGVQVFWVGTRSGLFKMEIEAQSGKMIKATPLFEEEAVFEDDRIEALALDSLGYLWLALGKGVYRLNTRDAQATLKVVASDHSDAYGLPSTRFCDFFKDAKGSLWIGTEKSLSKVLLAWGSNPL